MSFRYTRAPVTQHLLGGSILLGAVALGSTEAFAALWRDLVLSVPPRVLMVGGFMLVHTLIFWPVAFAFHRVDITDRPAWIARHRIQVDKRKHPPLGKTLRVLARNQFLFLPVLLWLTAEVLLARGWRPDPALPGLVTLVLELAGQAVIAGLVFYGTHRFLHRKWWLKRVHRVHHEFKTTTAFASEYAHPVEFVVGNYGTLATGALILAPSLPSMLLFATVGLVQILVHHSGYALPWASWSIPHDWHHYRMNEMFGSDGVLDRLLGTEGSFAELEDGDVR